MTPEKIAAYEEFIRISDAAWVVYKETLDNARDAAYVEYAQRKDAAYAAYLKVK